MRSRRCKSSIPRLAGAAAGSPELARFPLTAAQLVIARQYGFGSWARLGRGVAVVIRPVGSPGELARAFELIGARRAPALEQDRYFLQVARRFPEDRPLMLVAELDGQIIGAGFAFRKGSSPKCRTATLRNCAVDVRPVFERAIGDPSSLVRSMVVHVCTLHFFDRQWAIDLVAAVAASDKSANQREWAADWIRGLRECWDSDDRRRELEPDVVARTERYPGRWIVIRDGRVVATPGKAGRIYDRELTAGGRKYWVAPPGTVRPRIP
jgi:hypothetical protein